MGPTSQRLFHTGLAGSTQRVYALGQKKYLAFCSQFGVPPLPVTERGLVGFVAFAVEQGVKHTTIKTICQQSATSKLRVEVVTRKLAACLSWS